MKKILGVCLILLCSVVSAEVNQNKSEKFKLQMCEEILGGAMFNRVLEDVCGFNGGVKDKLKKTYDEGGCRSIVPQERVNAIANDVLLDSRNRYKAFGEKDFCEANLKGYADLAGQD